MSILLPEGLPARRQLASEGVALLDRPVPARDGQSRLRVALVNLMPRKAITETQIARLLGSTPHRVELTLLVPASYRARTTDPDHLAAFYRPWPEVREQSFDGLIVTGAPVETLPFEAVDYWRELTEIFDWADRNVGASYFICWAAQAALFHRHGVPKHALADKAFGVHTHEVRSPSAALLRGFGSCFPVPVSRHTEVRAEDLPAGGAVQVLADSPETGLCLLHEAERQATYMFNHLEYDADTLPAEYERDLEAGLPIRLPRHTFAEDDPSRPPHQRWRPFAHLLFRNWLDGLAELANRRASASRDMAWLLRRPLGPAANESGLIEPGVAEFRILALDELDSLPSVLQALAGQGLSPLAVQVERRDGVQRIALRLDGLSGGQEESTARTLLRLRAVRRVSYRDSGGHGGTFIHAAEPTQTAAESDRAGRSGPSPCSAAA
ncbi:MAG: homoserine O-succinyltransferase [Kiloniellales bacterium]